MLREGLRIAETRTPPEAPTHPCTPMLQRSTCFVGSNRKSRSRCCVPQKHSNLQHLSRKASGSELQECMPHTGGRCRSPIGGGRTSGSSRPEGPTNSQEWYCFCAKATHRSQIQCMLHVTVCGMQYHLFIFQEPSSNLAAMLQQVRPPVTRQLMGLRRVPPVPSGVADDLLTKSRASLSPSTTCPAMTCETRP